jgi:hypothetical protein
MYFRILRKMQAAEAIDILICSVFLLQQSQCEVARKEKI